MAKKSLSIGFLFDDTLDSTDGVAQYVKTLGAWLHAQGHEVCYLVGETNMKSWAGGQVFSLAKNQKVSFNGNRLSIPMPANRERIKKVLAQKKLDVIHVQVPYSPFLAQRVINLSDHDMPFVGTFHVFPAGWLAKAGSVLLRVLYGSSLRRISPMLAVSPAAAIFAKESYGLDSELSPNVVDVDSFKVQSKKSTNSKRIVFLGRLVERKGCRQLLEAFRILNSQVPDIKLLIAGDGPQRSKLESFVKNNKLDESVSFLGFVDERDKPELLASANIACFPSMYGESFGIVLIEAMAAGAGIVLGGDNPGYRSVLGQKKELLFDPNDSIALASKLQELFADKSKAAKLHAWQQKEVKKYDVKTVGPQLLNIYRQAIAKNSLKDDN